MNISDASTYHESKIFFDSIHSSTIKETHSATFSKSKSSKCLPRNTIKRLSKENYGENIFHIALRATRRATTSLSFMFSKYKHRHHIGHVRKLIKQDFLDKEAGRGGVDQNLMRDLYPKILKQACYNLGFSLRGLDGELLVDDKINQTRILEIQKELHSIVVDAETDNFSILPEGLPDPGIYNRMGLLFGGNGVTEGSMELKHLKSLFYKEDPIVMEGLRSDFHTILNHLKTFALDEQKRDPKSCKLKNLEVFLGNLLSMYIFLHPVEGEKISVPQPIGGEWKMVTYRCEWIPMTDDSLGRPYCALGLMPEEPSKAAPQLVFMGTTFPTSRGATYTYLADIAPGVSVGEYLFSKDKEEKIKAWLEKAHKKSGMGAQVVGQSLGGAMTLLASLKYPEYIEKVKAYAPAALRQDTIKCEQQKLINKKIAGHPVKIEVFLNDGDVVPYAGGYYPPDTKIYLHCVKKRYSAWMAHVKALSGQKQYLRLRVPVDAAPKGFWTRFHQAVSYLLFPLTLGCFLLKFRVERLFGWLSEKMRNMFNYRS